MFVLCSALPAVIVGGRNRMGCDTFVLYRVLLSWLRKDCRMGLTQQFRRPQGPLGRLAGAMMAVTNAPLVAAVTEAVAPRAGERVLDIGFGPGISLMQLARLAPTATLAGVDVSAVMVRAARRRTATLTPSPDLREGSAAELSWADHTFDAVCSTNSVQLWQPLLASLTEVWRVLRPGGRLVIGVHERAVLSAGGTAGRDFDQVLVPALQEAGFTVTDANYTATRGGQALLCRGVRPPA